MRRLVAVLFVMGAAAFGFLLVSVLSKLTDGYLIGYLAMGVYAVGFAGCLVAARSLSRSPDHGNV